MPNWKKIITSGSSGSLSNLIVDNHLSASLISGSFYGDGSSLTGINALVVSSSTVSDTFTSQTTHSVAHTFGTKDLIVNVYDSNDDIFVPSRINTPTTSSVVIYMDPATSGRVVIGKSGHIVSGSQVASYNDLTDVPSGILSSSAQIASDISGSFTTTSSSLASRISTAESELGNTLLSSSAQIASDISGSFTSTSSSLASRLSTAESELSNTLISSSAQIASDISGSLSATAIAALGSGIVSGSSQIDLGSATGTAANATSASYAENAATGSRSVNENTNSGSISFWQGSSSEYSALGSYDPSTVYFVV